MVKKRCPICLSGRVIKWGIRGDRQRYKCKRYHQLFVWKNNGKSIDKQKIWFKKWIFDRLEFSDIVKQKGCSVSTLQRLFKNYLDNPPTPQIKLNENCHLMIDGTYSGENQLECRFSYLKNNLRIHRGFV